MQRAFGTALVIGASMGGLMAARALSDFFESVIVIERDELSPRPVPRKGVPQGRHIHVLLQSGKDVIDQFFPSLLEDLQREGLSLVDSGNDVVWHHFGCFRRRYASGLELALCTRPFLEWHVRQRLAALPNLQLRPSTTVRSLLASDDRQRILGVRLGDGSELRADLVVDASGRGSALPAWLDALDYERAPVEEIGTQLAYTSRLYRAPKRPRDWKLLMLYPSPPRTFRAGFIAAVEEDRWIVSLNGYFRHHAPTDDQGFLEFARGLPRPEIYEAIREAEPLSAPVTHQIPAHRWHHYERLARFPDQLVPVGDAVCSLDPLFGQGMSVASLEARLLHELLAEHAQRGAGLVGFAHCVRRRLPGIIGRPWFLAGTLDLHYPQATGRRSPDHALRTWYVTRLLELASVDARIYDELGQVLHLRRGPWNILKPSVSLPVLAYGAASLLVPLEWRANVDRFPARGSAQATTCIAAHSSR